MEATGFRPPVLLGQEGHRAPDRRCNPCPDKATATEGRDGHCFPSLPGLNPERLKTAKALADKAVKMHRVFSVQGPYPVIRAALRARGWVEKRIPRPNRCARKHHHAEGGASPHDAGDSDDDDDNSDDAEKEQDPDGLYDLMSRLVRNEMVTFYWTTRSDAININSLQKDQIINHFPKAGSFTTKAGLCVNLRNLHWFDSADADTFFPRCYRLVAPDEKHAFIEDFRRTACTSLLKYILERKQGLQVAGKSVKIKNRRKQRKQRVRPVVLSQMIDSALRVCQEFLDSLEHSDIDKSKETPETLTQEQWTEFLDSYYQVVQGGAEVEDSDHLVPCCKAILQRLEKVNPQLDIEGTHNIWIIKPGAKSRGRGIKCSKNLDEILRVVAGDPTLTNESKWVVQKYLERPLLIHGTKFDVRQWFLVTDWNPLTVWFYKKCYLRFSTQPYSLDTLDSSIHLCNNSIQKRLMPSKQRHRGIPADNMWSDEQFRSFLSSQGREAQWKTVVVPRMKKAVIHALQTTQDLIESRKNTFELYGADFMLGCDLHPWLIEINSGPTMAPSTPVTADLCAAVQEDTLRVVLDRRSDPNANTGDFQLIYKQAAVEVPQYIGVNLLVEGFGLKCPCSLPPLRLPNCSAPKHRAPIKEKQCAAKKLKPPAKKTSVAARHKNCSSGVLLPPALPSKPSMVIPIEPITLHLPMTHKSIHQPIRAPSPSLVLWKKRQSASKVGSEKVKPCSKNKHTSPTFLMEIINITQPSRPAGTSTVNA